MHTFTLKERLLARFNLLPLPIYDVFVAPLLGHSIAKAIRANIFETLTLPQTSDQIASRLELHPRIASKLALPDDAEQLIDLAGSHGLYSIELCSRNPRLHATIVDMPQALKFTQRIVREHNLATRITLLPGDLLKLEYARNAYDAALAFNITHGLTEGQNASFFEKIHHALKPGGVVDIPDQCRLERGTQTERLIPLIVGINVMNEVGGSVYGQKEYQRWLTKAGFKEVRTYRLSLPGVFLFKAR